MTRSKKERIMFETLSGRGILCTAAVQNAVREGFRIIERERMAENTGKKEARRIRAAKRDAQAAREGRAAGND